MTNSSVPADFPPRLSKEAEMDPEIRRLIRRIVRDQADARDLARTQQMVARRGRRMSGSVDRFRRAAGGRV